MDVMTSLLCTGKHLHILYVYHSICLWFRLGSVRFLDVSCSCLLFTPDEETPGCLFGIQLTKLLTADFLTPALTKRDQLYVTSMPLSRTENRRSTRSQRVVAPTHCELVDRLFGGRREARRRHQV
jgi:hypothetical protein